MQPRDAASGLSEARNRVNFAVMQILVLGGFASHDMKSAETNGKILSLNVTDNGWNRPKY